MERISYGGWDNCYKLANGKVELVVTGDVGPRVIRLAANGGDNLFKEFAEMMGKTGGDEWRIYGGHRFWHAPEEKPRTYMPDNVPVNVEETESGLRTLQETEPETGIQKQIEIDLAPNAPYVRVTHTLFNRGVWPVKLAPWALSVMAPGGTCIIPQAPFVPHEKTLLPARPVVLWPYTNMADARWTWGEKYIQLRQDPNAEKPQKVGIGLEDGWAAYANNGTLFLKRYVHDTEAEYPDFGCSFETFTNDEMLEVESLAPMVTVAPGESATHVENWFVFENVEVGDTDESIAAALAPVLELSAKLLK